MCKRHTSVYRKLDKEAKQRKRAKRRADGLCIWCPGDNPSRPTHGSPTCLACRVKHRKVRMSDGAVPLDVYLKQREVKIAAATHTHEDGRTRFHGQQKRGQQPKGQLNVQDLVHVQQDYDGFVAGVMVLVGSEVAQLHKSDRLKVQKATARLGDRAARRMGDITKRLGLDDASEQRDDRPAKSRNVDSEDPDSWHYSKPADAPEIASAAASGQYVYAPPLESDPAHKPPDLGPLRTALANRGLGLQDESAFYWLVVQK